MKKSSYLMLLLPCGLPFVAAALYPETYRALQADSFFLFTTDFFHEKLHYQSFFGWLASLFLQFFRWPFVAAALQAFFALCVTLLLTWLTCRLFPKKSGSFQQPLSLALSTLFVSLCFIFLFPLPSGSIQSSTILFTSQTQKNETYYRILRAAEEERWNDVRTLIWQSGEARTRLMQAYLLLAESAQGTLPENLFSYPINDSEDFLFRHERNRYTCQFNRLFYRNLEVWDEAFHQAQEYYLLQPDACCFSSLTQMVDYSIRAHEYAVAEKYLTILGKAPFYGSYVKEQRLRIIEQQRMDSGADSSDIPLRADNFVGGYPFNSEMLRLVKYTTHNKRKAYDYLLCSLLLQKNLPHFRIIFEAFPFYRDASLPEPYRQALRILETNGQGLNPNCSSGSYEYYYQYTAIPEPNQKMLQSTGH